MSNPAVQSGGMFTELCSNNQGYLTVLYLLIHMTSNCRESKDAYVSVDDLLDMQTVYTHELYLKDEVFSMHNTLQMVLYPAIKTKRK